MNGIKEAFAKAAEKSTAAKTLVNNQYDAEDRILELEDLVYEVFGKTAHRPDVVFWAKKTGNLKSIALRGGQAYKTVVMAIKYAPASTESWKQAVIALNGTKSE